MSCLHPIEIHYDDVISKSSRAVVVPCGKCVECLRKYQNDWFLRMTWELMSHPNAVFFSLTYNEESVPYSDCGYKTCSKSHVQNWIKTCRELYFKRFNKRLDFKYFICSEYGPRTFRPHYHGIFFGMDKNFFNLYFGNYWRSKYGFVSVSDLWRKSFGAARYVSKYCSKGMFECPYVREGYVEKPFRLVSKGLGVEYVNRFKNYHLARDVKNQSERVSRAVLRSKLFNNGFGYSLPRYYRAKIFGCSQENLSATAFRRKMSNYIQSEVYSHDLFEYKSLLSRNFSPSDIEKYFKSKLFTEGSKALRTFEDYLQFYSKSEL